MNLFVGIGIDTFDAAGTLSPLRGSLEDSQRLERVLRNRHGWQTATLNNRGADMIEGYLAGLGDQIPASVEDVSIVIYLATHGCLGPAGRTTYLAMPGCGRGDYDRMVPSDRFAAWLDKGLARFERSRCRILFVFDCCRGVAIRSSELASETAAEGVAFRDIGAAVARSDRFQSLFWYGCAEGENSLEVPVGGGRWHGLFSACLADRLESGTSESFRQLVEPVENVVVEESKRAQHPSVEGQLSVLSRFKLKVDQVNNAKPVRAGRLSISVVVIITVAAAVWGSFRWSSRSVTKADTGGTVVVIQKTGRGAQVNVNVGQSTHAEDRETPTSAFHTLAPKPAIPPPDNWIRSIILEADVSVPAADGTPVAEAQRRAQAEAKSQILRDARARLDGLIGKRDSGSSAYRLTVEDGVDIVKVVGHQDHGTTVNGQYHARILGEVRYDITTVAPGRVDMLADAVLPLTVRVWTPRQKYREGERIVVHLQGNRDFHARLLDISPDGTVYELLPNDYRRSNLFLAGKIYTVPDKAAGDAFDLEVEPPFGTERIVLYASDAILGDIPRTALSGVGIHKCDVTEEGVAEKTRAIRPVPANGGSAYGAEFCEARWHVITVPE